MGNNNFNYFPCHSAEVIRKIYVQPHQSIFTIILGIFALLANTIIIYLYFKYKQMRKVPSEIILAIILWESVN